MGFLRRRQLRIPGKGIEALLIRGHASIRVRVHQLRLRKPGEKYAGLMGVIAELISRVTSSARPDSAVGVMPLFRPGTVLLFCDAKQLMHIIIRVCRITVHADIIGIDRSQSRGRVPDTHPHIGRVSHVFRKRRKVSCGGSSGYGQNIGLGQYSIRLHTAVRILPVANQFRAVDGRGGHGAGRRQTDLNRQILQRRTGYSDTAIQKSVSEGGCQLILRLSDAFSSRQADCSRYHLRSLNIRGSAVHGRLSRHLINGILVLFYRKPLNRIFCCQDHIAFAFNIYHRLPAVIRAVRIQIIQTDLVREIIIIRPCVDEPNPDIRIRKRRVQYTAAGHLVGIFYIIKHTDRPDKDLQLPCQLGIRRKLKAASFRI